MKSSCLLPFRARVHSPEDFCFLVLAKYSEHPRANPIGCVKRSCPLLLRLQGCRDGDVNFKRV